MVGPRICSTESHNFLRKVRKPMIEKRRRDRMNVSIDQIKTLLTASGEISPTSKVDKAEILEMAVSFIARYSTDNTAVAIATRDAYQHGYQDSARETIIYLQNTRVISPGNIGSLDTYLRSRCSRTSGERSTVVTPDFSPDVPARCRAMTSFESDVDSVAMDISVSSESSSDRSCTEDKHVWRPW